jgi:hypothetical protein
MRIGTAALLAALIGVLVPAAPPVHAQTAIPAMKMAQVSPPPVREARARRPLRRIYIYPRLEPDGVYPRYNPGPNAVRDCSVAYVQEFRPSGTVITPHMSCFWRRG